MNFRNILPLCLSAISLSMVSSIATAGGYPQSIEEDLVSVCRNSAANDRMGLHRSVEKFTTGTRYVGTAYKMLGEGLVCNGMTLSAFTEYHGAADTLRVLDRYIIPTSIEIRDLNVSRTVPEDISVAFAPPMK